MTNTVSAGGGLEILKRYAILAYGAFGSMLDVALMVLGSLLLGLAATVLLAGFELVDVVPEEMSTGAMLASALVLGVVGLFCLGVALEGPLGRGRRLVGFQLWEVGVGRALAVVGVGFAALLAYGALTGLLDGLPQPFHQGTEGLRAVAITGTVVMPLIGVPLSLLMRWLPTRYSWMPVLDIPILFVVWVIAAMVELS